jgi:anthranilate phosphoribosyltransferase
MTEGVATTDLSQESARDLLTALLEGEANDGDLTAA